MYLKQKQKNLKKAERRQRRHNKIITSVEAAKINQRNQASRFQISHSNFTGRKLSIHSTSYAALFFILVLTAAFALFITQYAATAAPPPQDGSINVGGVVNGPPPTNPAVILVPDDGDKFKTSIITVSGTCEAGLLVEIYRNNSFAGSVVCDGDGKFSLQITIVQGKNTLIAKVSDSLNQYGPDSEPVVVYLLVDGGAVTEDDQVIDGPLVRSGTIEQHGGKPFLIFTRAVQRGLFPEETLKLEYEIDGGQKPYAISIDWGDKSEPDISVAKKAGDYIAQHVYETAGQRTIQITGRDDKKNKAFTQTIAIINGRPTKIDSGNIFTTGSSQCQNQSGFVCAIIRNANLIWPVLIVTLTMTFSFWVGEQTVIHRYKRLTKNA